MPANNNIVILSIVSYNIFPAKLGGQKGIAVFNEYLSKHCKLICVTVKSNLPSYAKGYHVINILSNSPLRYVNIFYCFTISRLIRQNKATHLLLEHPYYGWLAFFLKLFTGVKLVIHSHNIEATRWKTLGKWWWQLLALYENLTHKLADFNFFIHDDDKAYAIKHYHLDPRKCTTITYGIEWDRPPSAEERLRCRNILKQQYKLEGQQLFLFNGTLDYKPNFDALQIILETINPLLLRSDLSYKIIICGRGLPDELNELKAYKDKNIIYPGFVDDITIYFKGADVFMNPVVDGGGIKTKLVEALGYNTKAVSTCDGSIGVNPAEAGEQLIIVPDNKWDLFARQLIFAAKKPLQQVPEVFYKKFFWGNIASKAADFIKQ